MHYYVLTLFPEMITNACGESILGRASQKGLISVEAINIRDYSTNKHNRVDDYPYGGGAGMVMQPMPVYDAWKDLTERIGKKPRVLFMTPQGKPFSQKLAEEYAKEEDLIFLCGHYEGIDQRVLDLIVTDEVSAGDFVLTGGELPAMMMIDCISRLVPGVLNNEASAQDESFEGNLLEYPQYTRPEVFMGESVPPVLLSGHHGNIDKWRREQSILRTAKKRPDLLKNAELTQKEKNWLREQLIKKNKKAEKTLPFASPQRIISVGMSKTASKPESWAMRKMACPAATFSPLSARRFVMTPLTGAFRMV